MTGGMAIVAVGNAGKTTYLRPKLLAVGDIPVSEKDGRRSVDVPATMAWIRRYPPDHAFIERAGSMPKQGVASTFLYGRAVGALEAIVQGLMIPMTLVTPQTWKRACELPADKEASRVLALKTFPGVAEHLARKGDHGRAEAILIAYYGLFKIRGHLRAVG